MPPTAAEVGSDLEDTADLVVDGGFLLDWLLAMIGDADLVGADQDRSAGKGTTVAAQSPTSSGGEPPPEPENVEEEHFRPVGTAFILAIFVLTLILLWLSVYVILISRGVTT